MPNNIEVKGRLIGGLILLALGGWVLHSYLSLFAWAVVLAITTWPIYQRLLGRVNVQGKATWSALILTLLIGAIILAPLGYGLSRVLQETESIGQILTEAQTKGLPAPAWLETLPLIGAWAKTSWVNALGSAQAANESLHWLGTGSAIDFTKAFASQIVHRFLGFLVILVVLFFVYQHGEGLGKQVLASSRKLFGDTGIHYATHAMSAVRATVSGLVLVSLGEGLLLGVGYAFAGLSHPALLGALTGVFAMIPFAAKLILVSCGGILIAGGEHAAGTALLIFGVVVILLADNYVRPALIGGSVKLPFVWTLLGIFGGLENFGLLGLFLGPTLMAVLMSIWRDWVEDMGKVSGSS